MCSKVCALLSVSVTVMITPVLAELQPAEIDETLACVPSTHCFAKFVQNVVQVSCEVTERPISAVSKTAIGDGAMGDGGGIADGGGGGDGGDGGGGDGGGGDGGVGGGDGGS